ncbi:hypothetical protein CKM354_001253600 [Cercospora kikuchii]|uniref:PXMP2/4 family protein 3 n=1 Tax=Cercospora kikuchii TaxID=84275 RepID=A0A9P3FM62_9PEZI|nr:uncharacterized protein CKM354_001253600 [Cercospora kikuchii]GIZ49506.1 hypothetical protein CKM354_001253600 [Cercospora kikuchii]
MLPPVVSATLIATALAAASNVLAQQVEHRDGEEHSFLSFPELLQFTICNLLLSPPNFYWQHFLERSFPARKLPSEKYDVLPQHEDGIELDKMPGTASETDVDSNVSPKLNWKNTAIKWFIDCITMGALLNTVAFLIVMGLLKGRTIAQIGTAIRTETFPIIFASYKIWPLASVVNFTLIPVEKRIVFLSAVGLLWGIYMSFMAARQ